MVNYYYYDNYCATDMLFFSMVYNPYMMMPYQFEMDYNDGFNNFADPVCFDGVGS